MKKKNLVLGLASVSIIASVAATTLPAMAHGRGVGRVAGQGPEMKVGMIEAIESGDYETWKELAGDRPCGKGITEENFERFAEIARSFRDGDIEASNAIREEFGLPARGQHRGKMMLGGGRGRADGEGPPDGIVGKPRMRDVNGDGVCDMRDRDADDRPGMRRGFRNGNGPSFVDADGDGYCDFGERSEK